MNNFLMNKISDSKVSHKQLRQGKIAVNVTRYKATFVATVQKNDDTIDPKLKVPSTYWDPWISTHHLDS